MSFEDIAIYRDYPVVNGCIQVAPCREQDKTKYPVGLALGMPADVQFVRLTGGSGNHTGSSHGAQEFLRLLWHSSAAECCGVLDATPLSIEDQIAQGTYDGRQ